MRALKSLAIFSLLFILLSLLSCRSDNLLPGDALSHIPDKATSITAMNFDRLMGKADFDQLKQMEFYRDFLEQVSRDNAAFAKILEDPRRAGIDLENNVYLSVELDTPEEKGFMALVFSMKDKTVFEQTLADLDLQLTPASQQPGLLEGNHSALMWNEEVGILGIGQLENVQERTAAYLNLKEDRSISQNDNLRAALSQDFDLLNWVSSKAFVELLGLSDMGKIARYTEEDLKENYLQSFLHFEDGAFRAETKFDLQDKLSGDLALVLNKRVKTDFSNKIPSDNLFFYANMGIRPKGINQLLIEYHIKGLSDEPFKEYGFTIEDFTNAFSGDVALAIYQKKGRGFNFPTALLALDIDSREHLDRILFAAQEAEMLEQIAPDRYRLLSTTTPDTTAATTRNRVGEGEILIKDGLLYFSDQAENIELVESGNFEAKAGLPQTITALTVKNAMAALIDVTWLGQVEDDLAGMPISLIETTANRNKMSAIVKMTNTEDNSLKQFFQWMNKKYVEEQAKKQPEADEKS